MKSVSVVGTLMKQLVYEKRYCISYLQNRNNLAEFV